MEPRYPVTGSGKFTSSSYVKSRNNSVSNVPGSFSRRERVEGVDWGGPQKFRDVPVGSHALSTSEVAHRQRMDGSYPLHKQSTGDTGCWEREWGDRSPEYPFSEEFLNSRTMRDVNSSASRRSDRNYELGSDSLFPFSNGPNGAQREDTWAYPSSTTGLKDFYESQVLTSKFARSSAPQGSSKTINTGDFPMGGNSNLVKSWSKSSFSSDGALLQSSPRLKQELGFQGGVKFSSGSREGAEEVADVASYRPDMFHCMRKNAAWLRGSGESTSQFPSGRDRHPQLVGNSNGNIRESRNFHFSSPQRQSSTTTANTSSLHSLEACTQGHDPFRLYENVNPGQKVVPNMYRKIPDSANQIPFYRKPPSGCVSQEENYLMEILLPYISNIKLCCSIIRDIGDRRPEFNFLLEIGFVLEKALKQVVDMKHNCVEVGQRYLDALIRFAELFSSVASVSTREGAVSTIPQQRRQQVSSQIDTNTRTSTINSRGNNSCLYPNTPEGTVDENVFQNNRFVFSSTPGISVEGSQTNESSLARMSSKGALYTDTEASQHSQYSARSHRSATVLDSSQHIGARERNKIPNKTKGRKRGALEQSSEETEQQNSYFKAARPPTVKTDIIEPPLVSNSLSSSEIERPATNTVTDKNTGKDIFNPQGEEEVILQKKAQLDASVANVKRGTEEAVLFFTKLKERNSQLLQLTVQMGRRLRQGENSENCSLIRTPEDRTRNTVEQVRLECENLKQRCRGLDVYICETDSCILLKCKLSSSLFRFPYLCIKLNPEDPDNLYGYSFDYYGMELGELGTQMKEEFTRALKKNTLYINIITLIRLYWKIATDVTNPLTDFRV